MNTISSDPRRSPDNCPICREELCSQAFANQKTVSSVNPCRHLFHTDCIYRWSTEHTTCPVGRRAIVSLELQLPLPSGWQNLLIHSARNGEYDQVLGLLKRGAPVDANCRYQHTPFAIAAFNKHFFVAHLLADYGSTDCFGQLCMGNMLYKGSGVEKDMFHAFKWFAKAADQGCSSAQFRLGCMYWHGKGVPIDKTLAVDWLKKAVAQEFFHAEAMLGKIYLMNNTPVRDVPQGLQLLNKAMQRGSLHAMQILGCLYLMGKHMSVDLPKAQQLLGQAAERNYIPAKTNLGENYLKLKDKEKLPQIITLLQSAVDQQSSQAMTLLGIVYRDHLRDPTRALELFHQAAKHKDQYGHYELGHMYDTGEDVPKDPAQAYRHFWEAAMQGYSNAQFRLGLILLRGSYDSIDSRSAQYWLGKAAEKGHKEATEWLNRVQQPAPQPDSASTPDKKSKSSS